MPFLISYHLDLSISERGGWKFPTIIVHSPMFLAVLPVFASCSPSGIYTLVIGMFFWRIALLITIYCFSLFLITFPTLKSVLSGLRRATPACVWLVLAWYIFLHSFTLNLHISLYLKWVSCRQSVVGSCIFDPLWQSLLFVCLFGNLF